MKQHKTKPLTLAIVIPVFNEEHHIVPCLDAVANQTRPPDEVIVVDNNCTDKTIDLAHKYPFVKIVKEGHQGHAPARNRGFDAVSSDIIGRIDGDSVIMPTWVERVISDFETENIAAVTGLGRTDFFPRVTWPSVKVKFWTRAYYWEVHSYFQTITTWGANMAVRRDWWQKVRKDIRPDDKITHEDQDIALLIAAKGGIVKQDNKLLVTTFGQSYLYLPKFMHYTRLRTLTRRHHQQIGTYSSPTFVKLSFWRTLPGRIGATIVGIPFIVTSFLLWPIDAVMLRAVESKKWLR